MKPDFVNQNGDLHDPDERLAWAQSVCREQRAKGANRFRASIHPIIPGLAIVEGWREEPDWNAVSEPEWGLTSVSPTTP